MLTNPEFRSTFRRWGIVFFLLVVMAVLVFSIILGSDLLFIFDSQESVPFSVSSNLSANYRADQFSGRVAAMNMGIIEEVIFDQGLDGQNAAQQIEEIVNSLMTPVPTVTPVPTMTATNIGSLPGTIQPTGASDGSATATSQASITPAADSTQASDATNISAPDFTPTGALNSTSAPSQTSTSTPTFTPTSTSSHTPSPTLTPSITPSRTPTNTPIPTSTPTITATPTIDFCSLIILSEFKVKKDDIIWTITNNSADTIQISEIFLDWPDGNDLLKKVKLAKKTIWDIKDGSPPTYIYDEWKGTLGQREIKPGKSAEIVFEFDNKVNITGYFLELVFNEFCVLTAEE